MRDYQRYSLKKKIKIESIPRCHRCAAHITPHFSGKHWICINQKHVFHVFRSGRAGDIRWSSIKSNGKSQQRHHVHCIYIPLRKHCLQFYYAGRCWLSYFDSMIYSLFYFLLISILISSITFIGPNVSAACCSVQVYSTCHTANTNTLWQWMDFNQFPISFALCDSFLFPKKDLSRQRSVAARFFLHLIRCSHFYIEAQPDWINEPNITNIKTYLRWVKLILRPKSRKAEKKCMLEALSIRPFANTARNVSRTKMTKTKYISKYICVDRYWYEVDVRSITMAFSYEFS